VIGYRWNHPQPKKFLIIHGFQSGAKKFERYITPMINKGYEVLAFDAYAHGESEGSQINVLEYKNLIEEVCKKYGPIDAFMAHSFGGLAVSLALENISHSQQTKVVLIAPATETSSAVDLLFSTLRLDEAIREEFENLIISIGGKPVEWLSISRAIKNIKARILWIHDEDDDITPLKDVQPLIKLGYPNIEFMITRGWGHRRIYHEESVIDAISSFL
jgi:pimeloyl-ACP methyl ester carboxylesterase